MRGSFRNMYSQQGLLAFLAIATSAGESVLGFADFSRTSFSLNISPFKQNSKIFVRKEILESNRSNLLIFVVMRLFIVNGIINVPTIRKNFFLVMFCSLVCMQ